jgi:tRNA(adenine34) deaminase
MEIAIEEAQKAYKLGEVPVGAIIVSGTNILAKNYNRKETDKNSISHAEMILINEASKTLNTWRLNGTTLYVTLEPCPMCAGAIIQSRISKVVYGAKNLIYGSFGTVLSLQNYFPDAKNLEIVGGILEEECSNLIKSFFRKEVPKIKRNTDA